MVSKRHDELTDEEIEIINLKKEIEEEMEKEIEMEEALDPESQIEIEDMPLGEYCKIYTDDEKTERENMETAEKEAAPFGYKADGTPKKRPGRPSVTKNESFGKKISDISKKSRGRPKANKEANNSTKLMSEFNEKCDAIKKIKEAARKIIATKTEQLINSTNKKEEVELLKEIRELKAIIF
jgi:hypothetical protein